MPITVEAVATTARARIFLNNNYFLSAPGKMGRSDNTANPRANDKDRFRFQCFLGER